jgi:hypothetical protein
MTPKRQLNFRVSALTSEQLEQLQGWWGANQSEVITVCVDRVYREEVAKQSDVIVVTCPACEGEGVINSPDGPWTEDCTLCRGAKVVTPVMAAWYMGPKSEALGK